MIVDLLESPTHRHSHAPQERGIRIRMFNEKCLWYCFWKKTCFIRANRKRTQAENIHQNKTNERAADFVLSCGMTIFLYICLSFLGFSQFKKSKVVQNEASLPKTFNRLSSLWITRELVFAIKLNNHKPFQIFVTILHSKFGSKETIWHKLFFFFLFFFSFLD